MKPNKRNTPVNPRPKNAVVERSIENKIKSFFDALIKENRIKKNLKEKDLSALLKEAIEILDKVYRSLPEEGQDYIKSIQKNMPLSDYIDMLRSEIPTLMAKQHILEKRKHREKGK